MNRTRDWRRQQRLRIRRRRARYETVRWAHELGDGRRIDIATEHPACACNWCRNFKKWGRPLGRSRRPRRPLAALSVEPVLLELTEVEPHFNWSDETEIDPLEER